MFRITATLLASLLLSGCVANLPLTRQVPEPQYSVRAPVSVAVSEERQRVKDGKKSTFIGVAHGAFGIPADWHVKPVISVEPGDKERNLVQFLEHRIVLGLESKGWTVQGVGMGRALSDQDVADLLAKQTEGSLLVLRIREWFFSINLNWVSAFNFDSDTLVEVHRAGLGKVFEKVFAGRDTIDEQASESPRNHILAAYRAQLDEILNDPEVQSALER